MIDENSNGNGKMPTFWLIKVMLSIIHCNVTNVTPERGLSINKYLLSTHSNNLSGSQLVALRLVKDELGAPGDFSKKKK